MECKEMLFWKNQDICADELKRFELLLLDIKGLKHELAIADPLKAAGCVI